MRGNSHNVCNAVHLASVLQATWEVAEVKTSDRDLLRIRFPLKTNTEPVKFQPLTKVTAKKNLKKYPHPHLQTLNTLSSHSLCLVGLSWRKKQCLASILFSLKHYYPHLLFHYSCLFLAVVEAYNKRLSEGCFVSAGKGLGTITSGGSPQVLFGSNSDVHGCTAVNQLTMTRGNDIS